MCRRHPEIKHYTRYKTARPILQEETDFKACKDEDERRELFEEFRAEALQAFEANEAAERTKAMKIFREILESLELEPYARWRPTRELYERKIKEDNRQEELSAMNEIDYLTVFEDYVKGLEKEFNDVRQAEKDAKYRAERKNREGFIVRFLLTSLTLGAFYKNSSEKVLSSKEQSGRRYIPSLKMTNDIPTCSVNPDQIH